MGRIALYDVERNLELQEQLQKEDSSNWLFWRDEGRSPLITYVVDEERKRAVEGRTIPGISALRKPQNRANLLSIYLLTQDKYKDKPYPLGSLPPNPMFPMSYDVNELKKFLLNEDNLSKEDWQQKYLDIFGRIYQEGSSRLKIEGDLSNDETLERNYQTLCLLDAMNIVGEMIGEIAEDCSPRIREAATKILDEKKDFYDHVHRVAEAAKQRLEFYKSIQGPEPEDEEDEYKVFTDEQLGQLDRRGLAKNVHARMYLASGGSLDSTKSFTKPESEAIVFDEEDVELFLSDPAEGAKRTRDARIWVNNTGKDGKGVDDFLTSNFDELKRCHEFNQAREVQRKEQLPNSLEELKESDPWYHINSQSYKKVLSCLEKVNSLYEQEPGKDQKKDLKEAYQSLYEACNTYLEDKTPDNRKTSLGKKRVEMIQAIREAVSPEPAREAAPSEPARTAQGVTQTNYRNLQNQPSSRQNGTSRNSGNQRSKKHGVSKGMS